MVALPGSIFQAVKAEVGPESVQYRDGARYAVSWDGLDEAGKPLSSGVYLMRLKALSRVETRKMTLMK